MKYYAIGEKKTKVKDEKGKEQTIAITVLINEEVARSRPWSQRITAQNEAEAFCRRHKVTLQGVYRTQIIADNSGIMTKNIKGQKAKRHRDQLKRHAATLRG